MAFLNENYLKLQAGYLFPEIARRVREFSEQNPDAAKRLIHCGIGDVTEPLPRAAIDAMKAAAEELGRRESFRGYGPEQGYEFLHNKIAITDPVYPVYVDTNVMAGHTGPVRADGSYEGILYWPCTVENNFVPE